MLQQVKLYVQIVIESGSSTAFFKSKSKYDLPPVSSNGASVGETVGSRVVCSLEGLLLGFIVGSGEGLVVGC